jgi:DNA-binding NarL/FixJ family response regulator
VPFVHSTQITGQRAGTTTSRLFEAMKHMLEREPQMSETTGAEPNARVVLMTADGGSIDITDAAGDLLVLARSTVQAPNDRAAATACPPALAVLCRHLRRCEGRCAPAAHIPPAATATATDQLTGRESEVVAHVRQGFTNKEIARQLGIQEDTVKKHLQAVFGKLGVHRRALVALRRATAA